MSKKGVSSGIPGPPSGRQITSSAMSS
jgi:hypothetical protein